MCEGSRDDQLCRGVQRAGRLPILLRDAKSLKSPLLSWGVICGIALLPEVLTTLAALEIQAGWLRAHKVTKV